MHSDSQKALEILGKILYVTVATVDAQGNPHNTPVYFARDDRGYIYWASWKDNEHSRNIRLRPQVALVVYDSTVPEWTWVGVYMEAEAQEVTDLQEIEHVIPFYYGRKNKTPRKAEDFLDSSPRRFYRAIVHKYFLNATRQLDGHGIDVRVEVKL